MSICPNEIETDLCHVHMMEIDKILNMALSYVVFHTFMLHTTYSV